MEQVLKGYSPPRFLSATKIWSITNSENTGQTVHITIPSKYYDRLYSLELRAKLNTSSLKLFLSGIVGRFQNGQGRRISE